MALRGDDRHLLDYFIDEVLVGLTPEQHDLLMRCSVLERLSGPLCDAVLGRDGSGAVLARAGGRRASSSWRSTRSASGTAATSCSATSSERQLDAADPTARRVLLTRAAEWFLGARPARRGRPAPDRRPATTPRRRSCSWRTSVWFVDARRQRRRVPARQRHRPAVVRADPLLCVDLAWASAWGGGRPDQVARVAGRGRAAAHPGHPGAGGLAQRRGRQRRSSARPPSRRGPAASRARWPTRGARSSWRSTRRSGVTRSSGSRWAGCCSARDGPRRRRRCCPRRGQLPPIPLTSPVIRMQTAGALVGGAAADRRARTGAAAVPGVRGRGRRAGTRPGATPPRRR